MITEALLYVNVMVLTMPLLGVLQVAMSRI